MRIWSLALRNRVGRLGFDCREIVPPDSQKLGQFRPGNSIGKITHESTVQALNIGAVGIAIVLNCARNALRARFEVQHCESVSISPGHVQIPSARGARLCLGLLDMLHAISAITVPLAPPATDNSLSW